MTRAVLALLAATVLGPAVSPAGDWPDFRGPAGNGHSLETGLPLHWSEAENVAWKVPVPGRGWSAPVVRDGRVWLTTADDASRALRALAFDAASGRLLHDVEVFRPEAFQETHLENSHASPAPVLGPDRAFVHFGAYGTAALDAATGAVLWRNREIVVQHEVGPGSSPVLWNDLLVVPFDGTDRQLVVAFDHATGSIRWRTPRSLDLESRKPPHRKAFGTPLVLRSDGREILVSSGAGASYAYDPRTGEELWRVRRDGYSAVSRPVASLGRVYVNSGYVRPHLLAVRLGGRGDVTDTHVDWTYYSQVPANPSPLAIGDRLYFVNDHGNATWLDARRGEPVWQERLRGSYYASPVHVRGRIYNFARDGTTVVLAAADPFEVLAENRLDGGIRSSPAVADHALFVRTETHLYRLEELPPPPPPPP